MKIRLLNVTDDRFLPGTVAAINSLLHWHKGSGHFFEIHVVWMGGKIPKVLERHPFENSILIPHLAEEFYRGDRVAGGAWPMKSYAACDLMNMDDDWDVFVGFDSDLFFCGDITHECWLTHTEGVIRGGEDQHRGHFNKNFEAYPNIKEGDRWSNYFSTSCYFAPNREWVKNAWKRISDYTDQACYTKGEPSVYPGHGDQGVTNATLISLGREDNIALLNNNLWSQHWTAWSDTMGIIRNQLFNHTLNTHQRACHSLNFWTEKYRDEILGRRGGQFNIWTSFLGHLFFGRLQPDLGDHHRLPELARDAIQFFPAIQELLPHAQITYRWLKPLLKRNNIHCMMPENSIRAYTHLASTADPGTIVEVGSYQGGSILTLACLFAGRRDYHFVSVESFSGDLNGKVDNLSLPSIKAYRNAFTVGCTLPLSSICLPSHQAVNYFDDNSLSMVMIDAGHGEDDVCLDIEMWLPKVKQGGIIAGDDYNWPTVQVGINLAELKGVQSKGAIWWTYKK